MPFPKLAVWGCSLGRTGPVWSRHFFRSACSRGCAPSSPLFLQSSSGLLIWNTGCSVFKVSFLWNIAKGFSVKKPVTRTFSSCHSCLTERHWLVLQVMHLEIHGLSPHVVITPRKSAQQGLGSTQVNGFPFYCAIQVELLDSGPLGASAF